MRAQDYRTQFTISSCTLKTILILILQRVPKLPEQMPQNDECVTTAMHSSGREFNHSRNLIARSQQS